MTANHPATISAHIRRLVGGTLSAATLAAGLAIGFSAYAHASPQDDYTQCALDHLDNYGLQTCCAFYGGNWVKKGDYYECSFDQAPAPKTNIGPGSLPDLTVDPGPTGPTKNPGLTTRTPVLSRG